MKLVIQVPCYNERDSVGAVIAELPRALAGFDAVEIVVIDDGSDDGTAAVALAAGAHHVRHLPGRRGLARAFVEGLDLALRLGADVVVNTDGDGQYPAADIPALVAPVLAGQADLVIGDRRPGQLKHFSAIKRGLQRLGSAVVRAASGTSVPDATSGFRAMSRECALRLVVVTDFSYTLETIIQAGVARLTILSVPVGARASTRKSRLASSTSEYVGVSASTILRVFALYRPITAFGLPAAALLGAALLLGLRFLYFHLSQPIAGHIQSLILMAVCALMGFALLLTGLIADLVRANRRMLAETLYRLRRLESRAPGDPL